MLTNKLIKLVFVLVVALIGMWLMLSPTSRYGAGISSDSATYISAADSFAVGVGFFDYKGDPLVDFPPLYPLILGSLTYLSGVTPFVWARLINAVAMSLLVISCALLFLRCFPYQPLWLFIGTASILFFPSFYIIGANVGADLLYILFSVWFCLVAQKFLATKSVIWLAFLSLLALLGSMLRWIGLCMLVTQLLLIAIAYRREIKKAALYVLIFGGLAAIPFALWVVGRNYLNYGTFIGSMDAAAVSVWQNLAFSSARIAQWFFATPSVFWLQVVAIGLIFLLSINHKEDWQRWLSRLLSNSFLPVILLTLVYLGSIVLTVYNTDHYEAYDDRLQVPIFFALIIIWFSLLDELVFIHLSGRVKIAGIFLIVVMTGVGLIYPISTIIQFTRLSNENGVVFYNLYNTKEMVRSGLVVYLKEHPIDINVPIYSNEPEAVYFFTRHPVEQSPYDIENYKARPANITTQYANWPPEDEAYLVWFSSSYKKHHYDPEALTQLAELNPLYKRADGAIYLVERKK